MADLRSRVIRLASMNSALRPLLLPLLRAAASGDPRWIQAKYPGVADDGSKFKRGDKVLYWPKSKSFMVGARAEQAWRDFQAQVFDEEQFNR